MRAGRFTVLVAAWTTVLAGVIAAPPAGTASTRPAAALGDNDAPEHSANL